jgi:hypothetical protein
MAGMFGKFFDTTAVDQYADWVIAEVKRSLPPGQPPKVRNLSDRMEILNQRITKQTVSLLQETKLNIYKKARLTARIRESLQELGYPESFVDPFSIDLIHRIRIASKRKAP